MQWMKVAEALRMHVVPVGTSKMSRAALAVAFLLVTVNANALISIYSAQELSKQDKLYRHYLQAVFREDLIRQLPIQKRAALSNVQLVLLTGPREYSPIAVGASAQERTIYFPIQTMAFLDDLSALGAWLAKHDCSFEPAALYAGMLAVKNPPLGYPHYPNPRAAFGLGDDVWDDPFVKKSSNQILKTLVFFTLAHELGHIHHEHKPYDKILSAQAQVQEMEADRFAIDAMRHIGVPPLGMFHFFTAFSRMEGIPTNHPLSGARLSQIAEALERSPEDFIPPNESKSRWESVIRIYAQNFRQLIPVIDNPVLRKQLTQQARDKNWSELQQLCH